MTIYLKAAKHFMIAFQDFVWKTKQKKLHLQRLQIILFQAPK